MSGQNCQALSDAAASTLATLDYWLAPARSGDTPTKLYRQLVDQEARLTAVLGYPAGGGHSE